MAAMLTARFSLPDSLYTCVDGEVRWNGRPMRGADAASFQVLGGAWARDARQVYTQGQPRRGLDLSTFELLDPVFARDASAVYDWEGVIKGADPASFQVLDAGVYVSETVSTAAWARGYARDRSAVYYHDQMVGRASAVRGADPETFVSLGNDYGRDAKGVWLQKSRLPRAEPASWTYLGRLWNLDRTRLYYAEREVTGVDRQRFTVVNAPTIANYATDGSAFFQADRPITEEEFWAAVSEELGSLENWFRVALGRLLKTGRR